MNTSQAKIPIVEIGEYVFSVGSTGDSPVSSGDPPDGIGRGIERKGAVLSQPHVTAIPPGGSPGGRVARTTHAKQVLRQTATTSRSLLFPRSRITQQW